MFKYSCSKSKRHVWMNTKLYHRVDAHQWGFKTKIIWSCACLRKIQSLNMFKIPKLPFLLIFKQNPLRKWVNRSALWCLWCLGTLFQARLKHLRSVCSSSKESSRWSVGQMTQRWSMMCLRILSRKIHGRYHQHHLVATRLLRSMHLSWAKDGAIWNSKYM